MKVIKYRDGYKYQLWKSITTNRHIPLRPIFGTSSTSLDRSWRDRHQERLRLGRPQRSHLRHESFMRGSLVHDALYQLIEDGVGLLPLSDRAQADAELRRICLEDGMSSASWAWLVYKAVRMFGDDGSGIAGKGAVDGPVASPLGNSRRWKPA